jgi:hypothetical protein
MEMVGRLIYGLILPGFVDGNCSDGSFPCWLGKGFSITLFMMKDGFFASLAY